MKGNRFYADYSSKAHKRRDAMSPRHKRREGPTPAPAANVIAVDVEGGRIPYRIQRDRAVADCTAALFDTPDSDVTGTSVDASYLMERCRRISEAEARRIHPRMFEYLEYEPD